MKKIFSSIAILAVSATCFTACFNLDEVAYSEILQESFVPNEQDVAALLASSYSEFGAFMDWYGMFDAQEEAADVVITPARPNGWVDGGVYQRMHEHTWYADDPGSPSSLYNYAFTGINAANRVMDQIKDGSLNAGELEEYALDELKAVRALWYAVLLDSHGNVPIVTSYKDTELPKQSSRRRVYEFVTKQFTEVIEHGVLSDEKSAATYGRLNMWGVKMALMRVYLNAEVYTATEQGKGTPAYDKALALAEDIIHNGPYSLSSKYLDNFQAFDDATAVNNTEIIFAIPYDNTFNTGEHVFCMAMKFYPPSEGKLHFGYTRNTWGGNCANPQFIKSYQEGDSRLTDTWLYGPQFVSTPARADNDAKTAKYFQDVKDKVEVGKRDQIAWWCLNYLPSITGAKGKEVITSIDFGCRQSKYQVDFDAAYTSQWTNDFPWFRLAEAYYTAAECILRGASSSYGDTPDALVNAVRQRSAPALTLADLKSTKSKMVYGKANFGDITTDMLNIYGNGYVKGSDGWAADATRQPHDWTEVYEALEASQKYKSTGADKEPIQFAGMYDEWGWEFALEGLRRQQMIRFGTFGTRNWFNHTAIGDNHTALFPIDKSTQQDNKNLGQNPGYVSANGAMAADVAIDDPIPDNM